MNFELYTAFVVACVVLGLIPGPNVALTVANSLAHGTRYGLCTVAGALTAMVPQLALTTLGLTTFILLIAEWFEILRWIGVCYLLWLGFRYWTTAAEKLDVDPEALKKQTMKAAYWRGVITSATNPKTLLFLGAFLPQFVVPGESVLFQMTVLSVTFIGVVGAVDIGWAVLAGFARPYLARVGRLRNKIAALFFLTSGVALALVRKQ